MSDWVWWILIGSLLGVFEGFGGGLRRVLGAWQHRGNLKGRLKAAERLAVERADQLNQVLITDPSGHRALVDRVEGQERLWDLLTRVQATDRAVPQLPQGLADEIDAALAARRVPSRVDPRIVKTTRPSSRRAR